MGYKSVRLEVINPYVRRLYFLRFGCCKSLRLGVVFLTFGDVNPFVCWLYFLSLGVVNAFIWGL